MLYVIGSGPAGTACSHALLSRGQEITMLDVGTDLEPEAAREVRILCQTKPKEWPDEIVQHFKRPMKATTEGVPTKYLYGSDYPYRGLHEYAPLDQRQAEARISHAKGGFSTIWGAAMLPFLDSDIEAWPISADHLVPYYKRVLQYVPLSAAIDALEPKFPLFTTNFHDLSPSSQASALLWQMQSHERELRENGIEFGRARLAIRENCSYCRMCLYGCPYGLIYNSAITVDDLRKHPGFHYQSDSFVDRIEESNGFVRIFVRSRDGDRILAGRAVFIGCGTLGTARIILKSKQISGPVRVHDSHLFYLPALQWRGGKNVGNESMHTMSQVFLELFDRRVSRYTVHLQLYTYNELYSLALRDKLGPVFRLAKGPLRLVNNRLSLIFGYLHSRESPSMSATLAGDRLVLARTGDIDPSGTTNRVVSKLMSQRKALGFVPVGPMMKPAETGKGNHHGGTFPMSRSPDALETDILGRPSGYERVYLVDASTFPSVPATTITLTIMANSYRIGSECEIPK